MDNCAHQERFYRNWVKAKDLVRNHIVIKETDLQILTDRKLDKEAATEKINQLRTDLESYIGKHKEFLNSLKPVDISADAAPIIRQMAQASKVAGVGPMAAVAGAMAEFLGTDLLSQGYEEVIIENGGDIFLDTKRERIIGVYAGQSQWTGKLFLKIKPRSCPLGICTSSATVGHSLSFGKADAVIILSDSCILADTVATASANLVDSVHTLKHAVDFARKIKGVFGVIAVLGDNLSTWGDIELIT